MNSLERDIYSVVAYFSFFGYPVTAFEIWKWQYRPHEPHDLQQIIETLLTSEALQTRLCAQDGFYALGDVAAQVRDRHARYLNAVEKYKKLRRVLDWVTRIPTVEGVAICNSLPFHFTLPKSDIDVFILAREGSLWSTRFSTVLPFILLRQRPGETQKNPIDVSFFLSAEALNVQDLQVSADDRYLSVWTQSLVPIFERSEGIFDRFAQENSWAQADLPVARSPRRSAAGRFRKRASLPVRVPESWAERLSRRRLPKPILERANTDTCVVMKPQVLKFHTLDRRQEIKEFVDACLKNI